jgi:hypothetical protein
MVASGGSSPAIPCATMPKKNHRKRRRSAIQDAWRIRRSRRRSRNIQEKPGEFRTGRTQGEASRGMAKKRYFENQAMRVAEGMAVRAVSPDGKVLPGMQKPQTAQTSGVFRIPGGLRKVRYGDIRRVGHDGSSRSARTGKTPTAARAPGEDKKPAWHDRRTHRFALPLFTARAGGQYRIFCASSPGAGNIPSGNRQRVLLDYLSKRYSEAP